MASLEDHDDRPWYADGLSFSCQRSGHCCTGGPGYVWISLEEIQRLAEHLKSSADDVIDGYCRRLGEGYSLGERQNAQGNYDCVFLDYEQANANPRSLKVLHPQSVCRIYQARPLQCRTWPFWEGNLGSRGSWERSAQRCPGMNRGRRYSLEEIERLRNIRDWPEAPPSKQP